MTAASAVMLGAGIEVSDAMSPQLFNAPLVRLTIFIFVSAIFEEVVFRAPLYFIARLEKDSVTLAAMIVLSAIFGLAHGAHDYGHLILQGTFGLALSVMFLKLGAIHRKVPRFDPFSAVVLTHFAFDMVLVLSARLQIDGA
jgi:membrane protease YdiL (CAAX protease family)